MKKKIYEVTEEGGSGSEEIIPSEFLTLTVRKLLLLLLLLFLNGPTAVIVSGPFSTWSPDVLVLC
jgi:hypothetical protein